MPGSSRGGAIRREPADLADGPDEAEVTVKIEEQVVGPQEISSGDVLSDDARLPTGVGSCAPSAMGLAHQRRAPKDAPQLACLVLIQHRGSRVIRTFLSWRLPTPSAIDQIIPLRGRSDLPVRKAFVARCSLV